MDVCIYLRKSRADKDQSVEEVLNKHKTTLLALAQKDNYNILDIKEEIVSGESIVRRPKMLELLEEVENSVYGAVLVMDMDRLGRGNMSEQGLILETFKEHNTKIITPIKIYNLENEFDEEYSEFEAFMARRELKIIKKRLLRGRIKSLEEGNYIASIAPFGYEKKGKTLIINSQQANVVKLIFDLYVNHNYGDAKIAKYLSNNKFTNASNTYDWDKSTIRTILKNLVYTGKVVWGKRKFKYDKSGNRVSTFQDKNKWKIYEGKHQPIIDEETFNKAETIAKKRYNPRIQHSKTLRNPLAGLIKCSGCGSTMTIRTSKKNPDSIRCYKNCGKVRSSYIYLIEERLLNIIENELDKLKYKFEYQDNNIDNSIQSNVLKNTLESKNKDLHTLEHQKDKLYDLLEQGVYDKSTFLERMDALSKKINSLTKQMEYFKNQIVELNKKDNLKKNIIPWIDRTIQSIDNIYYQLDVEQRNKFLKAIIDKVIYNKAKNASKENFELEVYLKKYI